LVRLLQYFRVCQLISAYFHPVLQLPLIKSTKLVKPASAWGLQGFGWSSPVGSYLCHQENSIFLCLPPENSRRELSPRLAKRPREQDDARPGVWLAGPRSEHYTPLYEVLERAAATQTCALKAGFASEGMLCNEPPIPLRVLDFLGTYELVNLSVVCKATHQAGHVLLECEVCNSNPTDSNLNQTSFSSLFCPVSGRDVNY
jgi:hypothetical protein